MISIHKKCVGSFIWMPTFTCIPIFGIKLNRCFFKPGKNAYHGTTVLNIVNFYCNLGSMYLLVLLFKYISHPTNTVKWGARSREKSSHWPCLAPRRSFYLVCSMQDAKSSLMGDSMYVLQLGAKSVVFSYTCGWELDGNVKVQQNPEKRATVFLSAPPHCVDHTALPGRQSVNHSWG